MTTLGVATSGSRYRNDAVICVVNVAVATNTTAGPLKRAVVMPNWDRPRRSSPADCAGLIQKLDQRPHVRRAHRR